MQDARECCRELARLGDVAEQAVLPFSTGVIGEPLPVERVVGGMPEALAALDADAWEAAAEGIMTTDTRPKGASRRVRGEAEVTVSGIAKGAGMIRPDMATMLAFVATDAAVAQPVLDGIVARAVDGSFNCITVDGDTSTNDACVLVATGLAGAPVITADDDPAAALLERACTRSASSSRRPSSAMPRARRNS